MSHSAPRTATLIVATALALTACKGDVGDKLKDGLEKKPQTSYCAALCSWATTCHEGDRDLDAAAVEAACLEATRANDSDCAVAEGEGLDAADSIAVAECTDAIETKESAGDCGAFTGSLDQQKTGTPPAECGTLGTNAQATFDVARETTQEPGDEMCDRYASTYCAQLTDCLLGDFKVPQYAIDTIGEPQDLCEQQLASVFTNDCKADGLYDAADSFTEINAVREAARECIPEVAEMTCDDLLGGNFPPVCAGTFISQDQAIDMATGLLDVACLFNDFAETPIPGCN